MTNQVQPAGLGNTYDLVGGLIWTAGGLVWMVESLIAVRPRAVLSLIWAMLVMRNA